MMIAPGARGADIFAEISGMPQVESSYVSGRFAHNMKVWRSIYGQHSMDLSAGFSALYSYQCYSEEAVAKARKILQRYLKDNKDVELMMKTTSGTQEYYVYEKFVNDNMVTQMVIWESTSPNVCEIVVIDWNKGLPRKSSDSTGYTPLQDTYPGLDIPEGNLRWYDNIRNIPFGISSMTEEEQAQLKQGLDALSGLENLGDLDCLQNMEALEGLENLGNVIKSSGLEETLSRIAESIAGSVVGIVDRTLSELDHEE